MNKIIPILHDIRSLHNVGSILRTVDGLGLKEIWVSGYTPYPKLENDERLPHVYARATTEIAKTALGAEKNIAIRHFGTIDEALQRAHDLKLRVLALEQSDKSKDLATYRLKNDCVLVLGNEVDGIENTALEKIDTILEIPMHGKKESFNVSVASAIALFSLLNNCSSP